MRKCRLFSASLFLSLMTLFVACEDETIEALPNVVFIEEAQTSVSKTVELTENGATASVSLGLEKEAEKEVVVNLSNAAQVLTDYNTANSTSYEALPSSYYSMSATQCKIAVGESASEAVNITINAFDAENLDPTTQYAIPVKIASASGADVSEDYNYMVIICEWDYVAPDPSVVFFSEGKASSSKTVTVTETGATASFTLSLDVVAKEEVVAQLSNAEQVLTDFNTSNSTSHTLLPSTYYSMSATCSITAGKTTSDAVNITINAFDASLNAANTYAIPVKIASATGADVSEEYNYMVFVCDWKAPTDPSVVFFSEAQTSKSKTVTVTDTGASTSVSLALDVAAESEVVAQLSNAEQVLTDYNTANSTSYTLLPSSYYSMSATSSTISAGSTSSAAINITINAFDATLTADTYAIPVKIASATGADVSEEYNYMVIICEKEATTDPITEFDTKVLFTPSGGTGASPTYIHTVADGDELTDNMTNWTVEFLVYCESFVSNKHVLRLDDETGSPAIFARFGDTGTENNQFSVKFFGSSAEHTSYLYGKTGVHVAEKWSHIAITCDGANLYLYENGEQTHTIENKKSGTPLNWRAFKLATGNAGSMCEFRFWDTTRTASEIKNNMYKVDAGSQGLVTYWKIDDNNLITKGSTMKDYAGSRELTLNVTATNWKDQTFPPAE